MTPEQLARDALRVVDRVERDTLRRILELLSSVERDARRSLAGLELREAGMGRTIRELRARDAIRQSAAARELLSMGSASGPIIDEFRRGVTEVSRDATRSAVAAATDGGFLDASDAARVLIFGTRVEPELLESFVRQTLTRLERISADGLRGIEDAVARGAIRGVGPRATARLVRDSVDLTRSESERIVRTVFMRANNEVRDASFRDMGVQYVQHNAANDERTCEYCEARHGMVYRASEAPDATLHPNCLVPGSVVLAAGVTGTSARWYEGPVVTITTRLGNRLTVTPNHPVLTPSGWVAAGSLNVGGHVISRAARDGVPVGLFDDQEVLSGRVEDVVDAFMETPEMASRPVPVAAEDFHGDGAGSQVAVVSADRHLWDGHDAALQEHVVQAALVVAVEAALRFAGQRGLHLRGVRYDPALGSGVCRAHLPLALALGHLSPLQRLGFGLGPSLDSGSVERAVYAERGGSERLGDPVGALTGLVPPHDLPDIESGDADADPGGFERFLDGGVATSVIAGDGDHGFASAVAVDDVLSVEWAPFAGHVYNLQTTRGWYVADGILTHNCRCVHTPWREDMSTRGDAYYERTRAEMRERREDEGKSGTTATARAPFERMDGSDPPKPAWAPGRGWL